MVQNDRVASILSHRPPRSLPELASRLATLQYYQSHLPLMKRISIPLYRIIKTGKFVWTLVEAHAYGNLLYLMGLQIKNTIYNPTRTTCYMTDTGALETALLIFNGTPRSWTSTSSTPSLFSFQHQAGEEAVFVPKSQSSRLLF